MNLVLRTGLSDSDYALIAEAAKQQSEIESLVLFGSRAKGNFRKGSDVDIAVKGLSVTYDSVIRLSDVLNEVLPLPYFFDVLNYNTLSDPELKAHIDRVGLEIYLINK
ncbi:nucleotidyltransferase domain-containing protein [Nitrincola alkalisediminis]|uniref:nucleotidyltransferase domain-containing protein n=1 Tax=Nitrincola alkalisediminis TaxID=1366656 RepID=UPI001876CEF7|nr:nucleotidyltransferase domain-containing protein [Nitrincola alkalisediminis]